MDNIAANYTYNTDRNIQETTQIKNFDGMEYWEITNFFEKLLNSENWQSLLLWQISVLKWNNFLLAYSIVLNENTIENNINRETDNALEQEFTKRYKLKHKDLTKLTALAQKFLTEDSNFDILNNKIHKYIQNIIQSKDTGKIWWVDGVVSLAKYIDNLTLSNIQTNSLDSNIVLFRKTISDLDIRELKNIKRKLLKNENSIIIKELIKILKIEIEKRVVSKRIVQKETDKWMARRWYIFTQKTWYVNIVPYNSESAEETKRLAWNPDNQIHYANGKAYIGWYVEVKNDLVTNGERDHETMQDIMSAYQNQIEYDIDGNVDRQLKTILDSTNHYIKIMKKHLSETDFDKFEDEYISVETTIYDKIYNEEVIRRYIPTTSEYRQIDNKFKDKRDSYYENKLSEFLENNKWQTDEYARTIKNAQTNVLIDRTHHLLCKYLWQKDKNSYLNSIKLKKSTDKIKIQSKFLVKVNKEFEGKEKNKYDNMLDKKMKATIFYWVKHNNLINREELNSIKKQNKDEYIQKLMVEDPSLYRKVKSRIKHNNIETTPRFQNRLKTSIKPAKQELMTKWIDSHIREILEKENDTKKVDEYTVAEAMMQNFCS